MRQPTKQFYEFGPFRLDPVECLLYRDGKIVTITAKIFAGWGTLPSRVRACLS